MRGGGGRPGACVRARAVCLLLYLFIDLFFLYLCFIYSFFLPFSRFSAAPLPRSGSAAAAGRGGRSSQEAAAVCARCLDPRQPNLQGLASFLLPFFFFFFPET